MPRGSSPWDEAQLQARLWTPSEHPGRGAWFMLSDPGALIWTGSAVTGARDLLGHYDVTIHPGGATPYQASYGEMARYGAGLLPVFNNQAQSYYRSVGLATGPLSSTTRICMVALCRGLADGTRGIFGLRATGDDSSPFWPAPYCSWAGRCDTAFHPSIGAPAATWFLWSQEVSVPNESGVNNETRMYRNGSLVGSEVRSIGAAAGTRLHIGQASQNQGGENWSGQIAEIAIMGESIFGLRARLEGMMAWRYGMQDLLPASHPYRRGPPLTGA